MVDQVIKDFCRWLGWKSSSDCTREEMLRKLMEKGLTPEQADDLLDQIENEEIDEFFERTFGLAKK